MPSSLWDQGGPVRSNMPEVFQISGCIQLDSSATKVRGVGYSAEKTTTGKWRITLSKRVGRFLNVHWQHYQSTAQNLACVADGDVDETNNRATVMILSGTTPTDPNTNDKLGFTITVMKNKLPVV